MFRSGGVDAISRGTFLSMAFATATCRRSSIRPSRGPAPAPSAVGGREQKTPSATTRAGSHWKNQRNAPLYQLTDLARKLLPVIMAARQTTLKDLNAQAA